MNVKCRAIMVVPSVIILLAIVFYTLGHFAAVALGIPHRLGLPPVLRVVGIAVMVLGCLGTGWVLRYRKPADVLVSTYLTMQRAWQRRPPQKDGGGTEFLVLRGPQRRVRHPLYLAFIVNLLGGWLALDYTALLFLTLLFFLWFNLVVIPFEEKELVALYGERYQAYIAAVPRLVPRLTGRRDRVEGPSTKGATPHDP